MTGARAEATQPSLPQCARGGIFPSPFARDSACSRERIASRSPVCPGLRRGPPHRPAQTEARPCRSPLGSLPSCFRPLLFPPPSPRQEQVRTVLPKRAFCAMAEPAHRSTARGLAPAPPPTGRGSEPASILRASPPVALISSVPLPSPPITHEI